MVDIHCIIGHGHTWIWQVHMGTSIWLHGLIMSNNNKHHCFFKFWNFCKFWNVRFSPSPNHNMDWAVSDNWEMETWVQLVPVKKKSKPCLFNLRFSHTIWDDCMCDSSWLIPSRYKLMIACVSRHIVHSYTSLRVMAWYTQHALYLPLRLNLMF